MEPDQNNPQEKTDSEEPKGQEEPVRPHRDGGGGSGRDPEQELEALREELAMRRVDHTPPPILISEGSIIVETAWDFDARDAGGGGGHKHRHIFHGGREVGGVKILGDAGDTIYLNGSAAGCSVKIWWRDGTGGEQIFVDGGTLTIETDEPLTAGSDTGHKFPKRERRHNHPNAAAKRIIQVEVVREGRTLFFENKRIAQIMVWDTGH